MRASDLHRLARQVRDIALLATGNVAEDAVTGGELAVIEDLARHPGSTVGDITRRTGLAQSLVSRICTRMAGDGVVHAERDERDARKRRLALDPTVLDRARALGESPIDAAVARAAPALTPSERAALSAHLEAASDLLRRGRA